MAVDKLVDSTQLDSDLTSVANAIRAKSGGSGQLAFPSGFVSEIGNIPSGGGGRLSLLGSGEYTHGGANNMTISVSYTGTPKVLFVCVQEPLADTGQGIAAAKFLESFNAEMSQWFPDGVWIDRIRSAANAYDYYYQGKISLSGSTMTVGKISNNYQWRANKYNWYIWGEAAST